MEMASLVDQFWRYVKCNESVELVSLTLMCDMTVLSKHFKMISVSAMEL